MKRIIKLTQVMWKSSEEILSGSISMKSKSPLKKAGIYALFIGLYLYFGVLIYFFADYMMKTSMALNQPMLVAQLMIIALSGLFLFTSITLVPMILYFSKDIENYLVMPIKPRDIIASKYLVNIVYLYLISSLIIVPTLILYGVYGQLTFSFVIMLLLSIMILPIVPLALAIIIVTLLMSFAPIFKNKNLFTYITTFSTLALVMYFSAIPSDASGAVSNDFINSIITGDMLIIKALTYVIPSVSFLVKAVVNTSLLDWGIALIISAGSLVLLLLITEPLYFKGVIGIGEKQSKHKKLSQTDISKQSLAKTTLFSIMTYDLKNMLRTPVFVINYFTSALIIPVIAVVPFLSNSQDIIENIQTIDITEILGYFPLTDRFLYLACFSLAIGVFMSNIMLISATAISREGKTMSVFQSMPISFKTIVRAKVLLATLISIVVPTLIGIILSIWLKLNLVYFVLYFVVIVLSSLFVNQISIIPDILKPKLKWEREQQAVKQNIIPVLIMMPLMFLSFAIVILTFTWGPGKVLITAAIVMIALGIGAHILINNLSDSKLRKTVQSL